MTLSQSQRSMIEKTRSLGGGAQGVALSDRACVYLVHRIVEDLGLTGEFGEGHVAVPEFYEPGDPDALDLDGSRFLSFFERLVGLDVNADTYFNCLATLHKARLKYTRVLATQPLPTMDQVGPRCLLQYGHLDADSLASLLVWRKWVYDIDNRAAQETGYLFEPIIANAIGGAPASAKRSPVRRTGDSGKGRQVDCLKGDKAYELKLRVTIAASGQGRWSEEMSFPQDCRVSGFVPVLVVLDPTSNPKLDALRDEFLARGGHVHIGDDAWGHLEAEAGPTMSQFLERYVRTPLTRVLAGAAQGLRDFGLRTDGASIVVCIGGSEWSITRDVEVPTDDVDPLPDDADDMLPGL
jgi:hypothetical protein